MTSGLRPTPSDHARESWDRTADRSARTEPARRARKFYSAERYIEKLVSSAPPLTAEQRDKLAMLLAPTRP